MGKRVLITGGAGFIGSHLADELLANGHDVRVLDILDPQVHGQGASRPSYLDPAVELVVGDVRNRSDVERSLQGVQAVFHLAAAVGVGQSMYELARYTSMNNLGTAVLLEAVVASSKIEALVVASSMSVYGEGFYRDQTGTYYHYDQRPVSQLKRGEWEVTNSRGEILLPVPTPETKTPSLASVYALSKYDQERMCLITGSAYGFPVTALRFFNVYGTRQALSNPYTGVLAIFASRYLNGNPPRIFEDGLQKRDFVSVRDVAAACRLAMESQKGRGKVFNIGSGSSYTVIDIAARMAEALGREEIEPEITGTYRVGDIRHCFADITLARQVLGYTPRVAIEEGLVELAEWLQGQIPTDYVAKAYEELASRGLTL